MIFGTQYYRPPFPGREVWRRDLCHIKALGFNTVKLWAVWNWIEREPGVLSFADLDELVEICGELELNVIINTIPEGAPYWSARESEHFYRTATGETLRYSGPANIPSAGWPGYCPDSPLGMARMCAFIEATAAHFRDVKTVTTIDVWNEPHLEPMFDYSGKLLCYCEHSQAKFLRWLKVRYLTVEALNRAWFRAYATWDQVEPPRRFGTAADMMDWRRFWLENLADWLHARVAAARRGAPEKILQTHTPFSAYMGANNLGGLGNELGDEFLLAREVDQFGLSSFPLWLMGEEHVEGHLINAEIIAEASGNKPFYQVELQGGAGKAGLLGGKVPTAEEVRLWNWNVIASGGKGVVYWQYAAEPAGMESPGFGLVGFNGEDTPRSLQAGLCARLLDNEKISGARRMVAENAIYLSRNADLFCYTMGDEELYNRSFHGIYRALYDRGIPVGFAHGDTAGELYARGVRYLYVPMGLCLDANEREALKRFANEGGRLIVEGGLGLYRENGEMDLNAALLNDLLGMKGVEIEPIVREQATAEGGTGFVCDGYRMLYRECGEGSRVLATFADGREAALHARYGQGEVVWLSGFAGLAYHRQPEAESREFLCGLFNARGYGAVEALDADGMVVRLLDAGHTLMVVCVNHSPMERKLFLHLKGQVPLFAIVPARDGALLECPSIAEE